MLKAKPRARTRSHLGPDRFAASRSAATQHHHDLGGWMDLALAVKSPAPWNSSRPRSTPGAPEPEHPAAINLRH
jgi:hypothetical protein